MIIFVPNTTHGKIVYYVTTILDMTLMTLPAPAGGATVLTVLNVLDIYGIKPSSKSDNLTYHHFIEVCPVSSHC